MLRRQGTRALQHCGAARSHLLEERLATFRSGANIFTFEPILFDRLYYVVMLLVRGKRMMQRSMSLDQVLRVADKQIVGNVEPPTKIEGPHGTLAKSDALR